MFRAARAYLLRILLNLLRNMSDNTLCKNILLKQYTNPFEKNTKSINFVHTVRDIFSTYFLQHFFTVSPTELDAIDDRFIIFKNFLRHSILKKHYDNDFDNINIDEQYFFKGIMQKKAKFNKLPCIKD